MIDWCASMDTVDSRRLQRAAGDFTTWKVREGLVTHSPPPLFGGSAQLPADVATAMLRPQPISTIAYAFVRRFAARKGNEAVMVLLEDITQFERIGAPQSRLKWARAIVASVVAELARNAIVASVVGPPSGALTVAGSNVHPAWLVISSTVNGTHAAGALADGLFMPVYRAVARAVVRDIMPAFTGSPEHRSLLMLARSLAQLLAGNGTMLPGPVAQPLLDPAVTIAQLSCMPLNASFFDKLGVIGSGSYGSVYAWRLKLSGQVYAVKICSKLLLKSKASVHTVVRELACSLAADSPFLMTPSFAFHDNENLHIGLPFLERGDLERWLLAQPTKRFDENIARWYTAQLVLGLRRLHSCGVIHRDLKASNLLVDRNGYLQLSDFGLSVFAHRCSKVQPEYTRPCWGEKSEQSLTACCLGCSLCSKLKVLQTLAEENEKRMPAKQAGQEAAQAFHLTGDRPDGTGRATRAFSRGTASRGSRDSRGESMEPAAGGGGGQGTGPGAMPATSGDDPYAGTAKASRGFFRLWGSKIATDPKAKPVGGLTSAHALTPPGILPSAASKATVDPDGDASMDLGQPLASAFSNVSTGPAQYDSPPYLGTGGLADAEDLLSPTAVMRNAPNARAPLEEGYINSTVMVLQDCTCTAEQDDGTCQWYRGRAGTAAYWAPQMLSRDAQHERLTYSFEADFWSLGCLTYALMTGRSPFASGLGSAHDNSMTLEGRIAWPKGIFSPTAKAFISCLCTVEPGKRLGAGKSGWAAVMKHPWFTTGPNPVDWELLQEKVLPSLSVPDYSVALNWSKVPDKILNQDRGAAAEEAAAADAYARSAAASVSLTAEDHAIFSACTFTHTHMWRRALLLRAFGSTGPGGDEFEAPSSAPVAARSSRSSLPPLPSASGAPTSRHSRAR